MKNFKRSEFACKCGCGYDTVDYELSAVLDDVREFFGAPTTINSGCRCREHNNKIGGSENSQHLYGKAADIVVRDILPDMVYKYLNTEYPDRYGIGLYDGRVHIDVRALKARWNNKG